MTRSVCAICGRAGQDCRCCCPIYDEQEKPHDVTPACCCGSYFCLTIILLFISFHLSTGFCYLELFANSVSISNANVTTADWRIGVVTKSPLTQCEIRLHTIKSRLLRGDKLISEVPPSLDGFGQHITSKKSDSSVINVRFENVVTPGVIGGVFWDYRVEFVVGMKGGYKDGFLMVVCGGIPVKFTVDPAGNMVGSLLGNMRRCDYLFQDTFNPFI